MRTLSSLLTVLALSFTSLSTGCAISGDEYDDEYADAESNAAAPGKVDLYQSSDSQWRFRVNSGNGRVLLSSEAYTTRTNAIGGLLSVLDNGVDPAMYALNQGSNGKWNLRLKAANTQTIGFTQQYATKSSATRAIGSCVNAITSYLDCREAATGARAEVLVGSTGKFRFEIHGADGAVLLTSEHYSTEALAWNGAFAAQDAAGRTGAFVFKTTSDNRFYFTIVAQNGQVVAMSKFHATRAAAEAAAASAKSVLATLDVL